MRSRVYTFLVLFFALTLLNTAQVKADAGGIPNEHSNSNKDKDHDDKDNSDKNLPINTALGALLIAGAGIGVMAIKKANSVNKAV